MANQSKSVYLHEIINIRYIMSIINERIAPCSRCGKRTDIKIYSSINTAENPELKEMVKDGSLFLWKCPSCGQTNLARYDTLYHDPEKHIMIWLLSDDSISETQMHSISLHAKAIGNYTLRRVSDTGSLMEKVLIAEAGLDDMVIEMCKYVLKMEMSPRTEAPIHFYKVTGEGDTRVLTFMYPDNGQMSALNIGYNVYDDCCGILQRNPHIKPSDGFMTIDQSWLSEYIG